MLKSEFKTFCEIMWGVADNFGAEINKYGLKMRFQALKELTIDELRQAAMNVIKSRKYTKMPTVAEILEQVRGNPDDIAMVEAGKVLQAIKRYGAYSSVVFDNPVTMAVIHQGFGGWIKLCTDLNAQDEKWFMKDFVNTYRAFHNQKIEHFDHLPGITETQNSARGFDTHIPEPVLIGNRSAVKRIQNGTVEPQVSKLLENITKDS